MVGARGRSHCCVLCRRKGSYTRRGRKAVDSGHQGEEQKQVRSTIPGSLGKNPNFFLDKMVHEIGKFLGASLGRVEVEGDLTEHKFWPDVGADGIWQGMMVMMCSSMQHAEQTMQHLNGRALMINGHRTTIQAFNALAAARGGGPCRAWGGSAPPEQSRQREHSFEFGVDPVRDSFLEWWDEDRGMHDVNDRYCPGRRHGSTA